MLPMYYAVMEPEVAVAMPAPEFEIMEEVELAVAMPPPEYEVMEPEVAVAAEVMVSEEPPPAG